MNAAVSIGDVEMIYEAPEVFELGNAEELTLSCSCGCTCDCCGGYKSGCGSEEAALEA